MNKESNFKGRSLKRNINIDRLDFVSCVKKEKKNNKYFYSNWILKEPCVCSQSHVIL